MLEVVGGQRRRPLAGELRAFLAQMGFALSLPSEYRSAFAKLHRHDCRQKMCPSLAN